MSGLCLLSGRHEDKKDPDMSMCTCLVQDSLAIVGIAFKKTLLKLCKKAMLLDAEADHIFTGESNPKSFSAQ